MINCPVDEFIPLPTSHSRSAKTSGMGYREVRERARAACAAALLLNAEGYSDPPADMEFVQVVAQNNLRRLSEGATVPAKEMNATVNTPEGALYVDSLLAAYDMAVVKDSKRLRHYVTNKLILEAENPDPRIRMQALALLGKISDVGLFTERTEITVNNRSTVELENSLRDKLRRLMNPGDVEDARVVSPPLDTPVLVPPSIALADL